jgi:hypothetical protein
MQVKLVLENSAGEYIKSSTLKVPDRSSRTSLVILAKKWASLSGVPSTTEPIDINTCVVHIPTSLHKIVIEKDSLDEKFRDGLIMHENKGYVWYEREFSYGTKDKRQTLKGVWR